MSLNPAFRHVVVKTLPKKEGAVARDLCDCLYYYNSGVRCEALAVGRVYVYAPSDALDKCMGLKYFKALVRGTEYFDGVSRERPDCGSCVVVKIGELFFVRRVD